MSYKTHNIRNTVLLGHPGSGKTTFSECMLYEAKAISRRGAVEDGATTSDYTNIEKERGNSIFSTLMHSNWKDSKINIIDTPGYDDFIGEVAASLKVADTAIMMLNAKNGVEVGTELLWDYKQTFNTPTLFVINHLDNDKADYETTLEQAQSRFGAKVLPVQFPINTGIGFNKIVDALRMVMYVFPDGGGRPEKQEIPAEYQERVQEMHNALVEAAAENEEGLMEKFFDQGTLSEQDLAKGLRIAMVKGEIYPVFIASATRNMGSGRIMGFINDICPSPTDRPPKTLEGGGSLTADANADTSLFIYKTISEPRVGMLSYFKVYSGTVKSGDELYNPNNRTTERISQLFVSEGKNRENVNELCAGDLGVTVKLKNSHTNQTLNTKGIDLQIEKIHFPSSRIRVAIVPPDKNATEKVMKALHQIEEEDPTLIVEQNPQLKQTLLHGQGQLHLDLIRYRIEKVNGMHVDFERPRIPYRETITRAADASYRHKKQSGGSGQFGEVHLRLEPYYENMPAPLGLNVRSQEIEDLPWGGKLAFNWCIVGGTIDSKYQNAIKKGIINKMENGPLIGASCQDMRVSIYDGKMHAVDSNDMAFMLAAGAAFKVAFDQAKPQLLEPIYDVEVLCSDDVLGDVMSDLQTRRAIIMGMDAEGHYQKIIAKVPVRELYKYSSTLRSMTQGRAKFTRKFAEYRAVPHEIQEELRTELEAQDADA